MAFPIAAVGAAGSLLQGLGSLGGLFGGDGESKTAKRIASEQHTMSKRAYWYGMVDKVNQAKVAGLHPLFALGGQGSSYTPGAIVAGGQSNTGSRVGDAISGLGQAAQNFARSQTKDPVQAAQVNALNAQGYRDTAAANKAVVESDLMKRQYADSLIARGSQITNKGIPLYVDVFDQKSGQTIQMPNPELNLEMPETVGAYYFGKGRLLNEHKARNIGPSNPEVHGP